MFDVSTTFFSMYFFWSFGAMTQFFGLCEAIGNKTLSLLVDLNFVTAIKYTIIFWSKFEFSIGIFLTVANMTL